MNPPDPGRTLWRDDAGAPTAPPSRLPKSRKPVLYYVMAGIPTLCAAVAWGGIALSAVGMGVGLLGGIAPAVPSFPVATLTAILGLGGVVLSFFDNLSGEFEVSSFYPGQVVAIVGLSQVFFPTTSGLIIWPLLVSGAATVAAPVVTLALYGLTLIVLRLTR